MVNFFHRADQSPIKVGREIFSRLLILILIVSLWACATPIGVKKVDIRESYKEMTASALSADLVSSYTKVVLNRYNLLDRLDNDTAAVISRLHEKALKDTRRDVLFALAELSFFYGKRLKKTTTPDHPGEDADYFLMSVIYAYYYLYGTFEEDAPGPYDSRFLIASRLYNRALGRGLALGENGKWKYKERVRRLPVGGITLSHIKNYLGLPVEDFQSFLPADDYEVQGLTIRNRIAGIGLPLIAIQNKSEQNPLGTAIPITAILKVEGDIRALSNSTASAYMEVYSGYETTATTIKNRKVPLETDSTTPLAYQLNDAPIWDLGIKAFLNPGQQKSQLVNLQPYQKGRIPVIFVHGTASSPVWWAEMWNTLSADPVIHKHFQFAFFFYNSSRPVVESASELRRILTDALAALDPKGQDPALRKAIVIGHSQGGLLTKLSVVNPGDTLWHSISDKNIDELNTPEEMKSLLRKVFLFKPLPFVKRVVYIATPFRGSYRAQGWVRSIIKRIVSLPMDVLALPYNVVAGNPNILGDLFSQMKLPFEIGNQLPSSVDSMSPSNPVVRTLAELPVVPGVKTHTIIAIDGDEDPPDGDDGVVEYKSAHQKGVESEYIVRSPHSCQGNPLTIEEVRRILLEHLKSK